jgi:glucosamine--fructose-6-phosphate aminotransferase (isomerizing)
MEREGFSRAGCAPGADAAHNRPVSTPPLEGTHLHREIHEQPAVVARLLREGRDAVAGLAAAIAARGISHVVIAARGTSDNAARYAQYVLGVRNGLLVGLAAPSILTVYGRAPRFADAMVLGISQSGTSPDIVAVLAEARRQGALTAVITNDASSDLAAHGEVVIDLRAGVERAVAATKTYTAELAAIALLSVALGSDDDDAAAALDAMPDALAAALSCAPAVASLAGRCRDMERSVVIGRGFNYATAFETALKLKELTYTVVEPYSSADFLHGPLALIERGFPVLVLASSGRLQDEMTRLMTLLREREADVIAISDDERMLALGQSQVRVGRRVPEWLSPLTLIVAGQLLAMHLAAVRGHDVDAPRGIRKVTRTT